ncbi:MAG: type II secretion system protein [Lachnospiraceae bacterium]|nr:type II secretion system protein [Lachnospiraceae bacterium]
MNSVKKNNSGFTLIEVVIAVLILSIISFPFVKSFVETMKINASARKLQNATLTAQDTAEEFKSEPLSRLLDKYAYTVTKADGKLDVYNFSGIEMEGANGEDFFVDVELDPNIVYDSEGNCVNGGVLPLFSNLYGSNTAIVFKQYVEYDSTIPKAGSTKTCDVTIECAENKVLEAYNYTYTISFDFTYVLADGTVKTIDGGSVEKTYSADEDHSAYILAAIFDKISAIEPDSEGNYYATDKINISYSFIGHNGNTDSPEFTLYLAEQPTKNQTDINKYSRLKADNVTVSINGMTRKLSEYNIALQDVLKINTNIGREMEDRVSEGTLTYSSDNYADSLFLMNVTVRYGAADGEIITTFTSTKEE